MQPIIRRQFLTSAAGMAALAPAPARAQDYPIRPVRLIVPYPPGGANDLIGRIMAEHLTSALRQPVVVENRGGAGGIVGTDAAAKARPDGYTVLLGGLSSIAINSSLNTSLPFSVTRDLSAVAGFCESPPFVVVPSQLGVASLQDFVAYARSRPGQVNFATPGNGTTSHLGAELFKRAAGIDMVHVPYAGGAAAATALWTGEAQFMLLDLPALNPLVREGKLRVLAVATPERSTLMPDVPTVAEAGYSGVEAAIWYGLFAPFGVPAAILAHLEAAIRTAPQNPSLPDRLAAIGTEIKVRSGEAMTQLVRQSLARWAEVVRVSGATVN